MSKHTRRLFACLAVFTMALSGSASASTDSWLELRSAHFVVVTDAGEKQARRLADQFERMRWVFQTLFPKAAFDPPAPIVVIALKDKKGFQSLEPAEYLAKGQLDLAGYFLHGPDKNYILVRLDAEQEHPFATVYHEYTHVQLSKAAEWLPLWLNEGLAEFFQNTDIHDKDVDLGQASADDILYLRQQKLLPLATLFKVDQASPYYHEEQKGSVFYAESWAMTHYLEVSDDQNHTHRIADYTVLMSQHQDPVAAAEKAFGDLKQLQKTLQSYISNGEYKYFRMASSTTIDPATFKVAPLTLDQANAVRADLLAYNQRTREARALLDTVLRDDPDNTQACETMGYLEFRDGHLDAAQKWYGQAVKLDSQNFLAHYYYAAITMKAGKMDDPQLEASLRAAIKLNPSFAPSYDLLARLYANGHEKLDEAHMLNLQAVELDPTNISFRMHAASVLMEEERYQDAANVLRVAARVAKTPGDVAMVDGRLKELEDFQSRRAEAEKANQHLSEGTQLTNTSIATTTGNSIFVPAAGDSGKPRHPTEELGTPKHTAKGVIHAVECSYPAILDLKVEAAGKTFALYSSNYYKIDFTVLNFTPPGNMNPCADLEGMKARVEYADSSDKSVDGQIASIELSK